MAAPMSRISRILSRPLCSSSAHFPPRSVTPMDKKFESWTELLRPGFTPSDVTTALLSQSDPDLALDIFRWASLRPGYRHSPSVYSALLRISLSSRRFSLAESLLDEILSGAPSSPPDLPLYNLLIRFCCSRRHLFSRAFDIYKKMPSPDHDTYSMLLQALLRRFGRPPVSYIHLHAVRSLVRDMKSAGVRPDAHALNLVVKAFARCLEMDEALRLLREMPLYGCEPNGYTYGYVVKGLCEKGRLEDGIRFFREMREKGMVPTASVYMAVVCSLAMEGRFEEAIRAMKDMIGNGMRGDVLTYRTVLEGLCREGRGDEAFELLRELGDTKGAMDRRMYSDLLDGLHWLSQPHDAN